MAHFAELDNNNVVLRVLVVDNQIATDEQSGINFLTETFGDSNWKQCSYNSTIRKQFPGAGYTYDPVKDIFISQQPYPSWILDANSDWQAPIPKPNDGKNYRWKEDVLNWVEIVPKNPPKANTA